MKFSIREFVKNITGNTGKTVFLGGGPLSSKVCAFGRVKDMPEVGAMYICRYRDGKLHEYGAPVSEDNIGEPIVRIIFLEKESIKKMSESLAKLYRNMGGESE